MITFLLKGLIRDRSRSLLPIIVVGAGAFLTVLCYSIVKGAVDDIIDSSARFNTGHVKVMTRAYYEISDQLPNDLAILGVGKLIGKLRKDYPDITWTPRIKFGGLLDIPDKEGNTKTQGPVFGMGVDLFHSATREKEILRLEKSIVRGRMPRKQDEILISDSFAKKLGVDINEQATILSSTMNGSMAIHNFTIAGTIHFGLNLLDMSTIIVDMNDIRRVLDMNDGAAEILGFSKNMLYSHKKMTQLAEEFNKKYAGNEDEYSPIMFSLGQIGEMADTIEISNELASIVIIIFVFAMSIVLWNAGLMNGIRRYGEIGVRLAMGEAKGRIYRLMIIEASAIGIIGSVIGTVIGLAGAYWFQYQGLDFSSETQSSAILMSSIVRAHVTPTSYYIGFFPGLFASVLGTIFSGTGIYKRQTSQLFKELEV